MIPSSIDAVALTQELVRVDTRNPPGDEERAAQYIADLLRLAGLPVALHRFGERRVNLVCDVGAAETKGPKVMLTGHLDTVTLGATEWTHDPFGGEVRDGRLYGRGASDMKAGVAAMVAAIIAEADQLRATGNLTLVVTGGEETGCEGAKALVAERAPPAPDLIVVGEPTANRALFGHKGALWLRGCCKGRAAHGSMPHLGDNAIYKAARAATRLEYFEFNVARHSVLGPPSLSVGTIQGGTGINSVPDRAELTMDIRLVPGMESAAVTGQIGRTLGEECELWPIVDLPAVWSDPSSRMSRMFIDQHHKATSRTEPLAGANYFTDASVFAHAFAGSQTIVCGPGDPSMAHKTDEYCEVDCIVEAVSIYRGLIRSCSS